jgi:hypothetical protein
MFVYRTSLSPYYLNSFLTYRCASETFIFEPPVGLYIDRLWSPYWTRTIEADRDGREEGEDLIRRASQRSRLSTPSPEYDVVVVVKLAEKFV